MVWVPGICGPPRTMGLNTEGCSPDQNKGPAPEQATYKHQELSCDRMSPPTPTTTTGGAGGISCRDHQSTPPPQGGGGDQLPSHPRPPPQPQGGRGGTRRWGGGWGRPITIGGGGGKTPDHIWLYLRTGSWGHRCSFFDICSFNIGIKLPELPMTLPNLTQL